MTSWSPFPALKSTLPEKQALEYAKTSGIVLMSQTDNLTPADKKLYALRDVTGTVDNLALISGSIMSKKIVWCTMPSFLT